MKLYKSTFVVAALAMLIGCAAYADEQAVDPSSGDTGTASSAVMDGAQPSDAPVSDVQAPETPATTDSPAASAEQDPEGSAPGADDTTPPPGSGGEDE